MTITDLGFDQFPRIQLRVRSHGGALADKPQPVPEKLLIEADELLLLVHGYATDESGALKSYKNFLSTLGADWHHLAVCLYWPGDSSETDVNAGASLFYHITKFTSYSRQPGRATVAAKRLAQAVARALRDRKEVAAHLGRGRQPTNLSIVAHSMGCRFALEFIKDLQTRLDLLAANEKPINIRLLVLMAPAVPLYRLGGLDSLEAALEAADSTRVYWSPYDSMLGLLFRFGQRGESDRPSLPLGKRRAALGRVGGADRERTVFRMVELEHTSYWRSGQIAGEVRDELEKLYGTGPQARSVSELRTGFRLMGEQTKSLVRPLPDARSLSS